MADIIATVHERSPATPARLTVTSLITALLAATVLLSGFFLPWVESVSPVSEPAEVFRPGDWVGYETQTNYSRGFSAIWRLVSEGRWNLLFFIVTGLGVLAALHGSTRLWSDTVGFNSSALSCIFAVVSFVLTLVIWFSFLDRFGPNLPGWGLRPAVGFYVAVGAQVLWFVLAVSAVVQWSSLTSDES